MILFGQESASGTSIPLTGTRRICIKDWLEDFLRRGRQGQHLAAQDDKDLCV